MAALEADPERGLSFLPLAARCCRTPGIILLTQGGDFLFKPQQRPRGCLSWLASLLRRSKPQQIPAHQLIGARLESPYTFTVWYSVEVISMSGCVEKIKLKACKTRRFHTTDAISTAALVEHLRRCSSWWGRNTPPHIAAIVNPVSGRGGAVRRFEADVLPLLRDVAGLRVTVHRTRAPLHASQLVREMNFRSCDPTAAGGAVQEKAATTAAAFNSQAQQQQQKFKADEVEGEGVDMLLFVGGDGTLYEGLQGLFRRPDWDSARRTPLAVVPCGSGNGLAASSGLWDAVTAAVSVCRGRLHPIDVASVLQPPGNRFYCILSMVYGAMANLDIGTNHLRWMGELRFHLGGLMELIRGRLYSCRLFVLPPTDSEPQPAAALPLDSAVAAGVAAATAEAAGPATCGVGAVAAAGAGCLDQGDGSNLNEPLLSGLAHATPPHRQGTGGLQLADYPQGPALPLLSQLPSLPQPLPNSPHGLPYGWVQLADTFAILGAYNTPYLALGAKANPGGNMADGAWDVWHLDAQAPTAKKRSELGSEAAAAAQGGGGGDRGGSAKRADGGIRLRALKVLLGIEDGSFARSPGVMGVIKARALMFEQRDSSTWTVLDGEEAPNLPLFLEVHPGLCSLLVSPRYRQEEPL